MTLHTGRGEIRWSRVTDLRRSEAHVVPGTNTCIEVDVDCYLTNSRVSISAFLRSARYNSDCVVQAEDVERSYQLYI